MGVSMGGAIIIRLGRDVPKQWVVFHYSSRIGNGRQSLTIAQGVFMQ